MELKDGVSNKTSILIILKSNNITLKMLQEKTDQIWVRHAVFNVAVIYGDLTAQEYMAYSLKFFKHKQEWK